MANRAPTFGIEHMRSVALIRAYEIDLEDEFPYILDLQIPYIKQLLIKGKICANSFCHRPLRNTLTESFKCASCRMQYCSRECQKEDWKYFSHKKRCGNKLEELQVEYGPGPLPSLSRRNLWNINFFVPAFVKLAETYLGPEHILVPLEWGTVVRTEAQNYREVIVPEISYHRRDIKKTFIFRSSSLDQDLRQHMHHMTILLELMNEELINDIFNFVIEHSLKTIFRKEKLGVLYTVNDIKDAHVRLKKVNFFQNKLASLIRDARVQGYKLQGLPAFIHNLSTDENARKKFLTILNLITQYRWEN